MEQAAQKPNDQLRQMLQQSVTAAEPFCGSHDDLAEVAGESLTVWFNPQMVPQQLAARIEHGGRNLPVIDCCLGKGDWSTWLRTIESLSVDSEVRELLACDLDFRSTAAFKRLLHEIETGRPTTRNLLPLDTPEKVEAYFADLCALIVSIRSNGVVRRPQHDMEQPEAIQSRLSVARPLLVELTESEIGLAVNAEGQLLRLGPGHHRMSIARQLGLTRAPGELRLFHVKWVRGQMRAHGCGPLNAIRLGLASLPVEPLEHITSPRAVDQTPRAQSSGETP